MEFQAICKRRSKLGFWNKCIFRVVNDTITFSKLRSKKVDNSIIVSTNTKFEFEKSEGKELITITDGSKKIIFTKKTNMIDCYIALRSTKFANTRLHLNDFLVMANIGQGSFGTVSLVQHRLSKEIYALKTMNKKHLYDTKSIRTVLSERKLLEKLYDNNPFLIKIEFAFQNATDFFLGLEYAPGGDMRRLLDHTGRISVSDLKIYLSEIAICLNSLHKQKIIYRDLKPENILITASGHIKLTDFGLSKDLNRFDSTSTFCGTLSYLSPEIVSHNKYSYEIDWYQLGILAYELYFGKVPFDDENRNKQMEKIISSEPEFPNDAYPPLVDLIKCLIEKDPKERMNFIGFKTHHFFDDFSFQDVEEKKVVPSFIPSLSHPADTRYFSPKFESESGEAEISLDDINLFEGFSFISNEFNSYL